VKTEVQKYLENTTQAAFDAKKEVDQVAGKQLSIQLNQDYRAAENFRNENQGAVVNIVGEKDEDQEIQVFPPAGKSVLVKSIIAGGNQIPTANIGRYIIDKNGKHRATVSYSTMIPVPFQGAGMPKPGAPQQMKEVLVTEEMELTDPGTINQIRAQFKMEPIKEVSLSTPTKKKPY
jgi:hypothetical protein